MIERLALKPPSVLRRALEKLGVEIVPWDLCPDRKILDNLYKNFPDLAGDGTAIGLGDDGNCQSWRKYPGWWRELVEKAT